MKALLVAAFALFITGASAQDSLQYWKTADPIRYHEEGAKWYSSKIPWFIGFGTIFTALSMQPEHIDDDIALAFGIGTVTACSTVALTIGYGEQKRKAKQARMAHLQ